MIGKMSYMRGIRGLLLAIGAALILNNCQPTQQRVVELPAPEPEPVDTRDYAAEARVEYEAELSRQRRIADVLFEGVKALNANRLMTPLENSALTYFNRALAMDPGNEVALQGIQDIVGKYLQLASEAGRQGQFASAESYLRRAEQVDREHPGIAPAWVALEQEKQSSDEVHTLDGRALANQSPDLSAKLGEIGQKIRESGAFVLITAPNDAQARWIYAQMQAAVEGYRIRGNIEMGGTPTIRLILPTDGGA